MNKKEAKIITGGLSKPSKMPGHAYNLPAWRCVTGVKLQAVKGSVCAGCYAMKGRYRFKNVKDALQRRMDSLDHPQWVQAMVVLIDKQPWFRWHDSGDLQSLDHLNKIFEVCRLTPETRHWMPTREAWIKDHLDRAPANLVIRFSPPMVDMKAPDSWPNSSSVISKDQKWFGATSVLCPAPKQGGKCGDCRQCWNPEIKNVSYWKH